MPIIRIRKKNVLFVHIPKTGGATVKRYLAQHGEVGLFHPKKDQTNYQCTPQHFDVELLAPLFPPSFIDYRFTCVRHPLDRIISEYKMRVGHALRDGKNFLSFANWFEKHAAILENTPRVLDNHLNRQVNFVDERTKVFKFEDGVINNLAQIQKDLHIKFDLKKNIHRQKSHKDILVELSEGNISEIGKIYAEDFKKFGYTMEKARFFSG